MTAGSLACGYAADTDNTAIDTTPLCNVGVQGRGYEPLGKRRGRRTFKQNMT